MVLFSVIVLHLALTVFSVNAKRKTILTYSLLVGGSRFLVPCISEGQNGQEDVREQNKPNGKSCSFAKTLGQIQHKHDLENDADAWGKHQQAPPDWFADDFSKDHVLVDGNYCRPTRLPGFGIDNPQGDKHNKRNSKDEENKTNPADRDGYSQTGEGASDIGWPLRLGLREQDCKIMHSNTPSTPMKANARVAPVGTVLL
jgi:hypothetical protein